jgi:hypothetical protein
MEDGIQSSRRQRAPARPESSGSSNRDIRITPSSSQSGSTSGRGQMRGVNGGSLLQERLRERKGERRRSVDAGGERDRVPSSPAMAKEERRPSSSGGGKSMGVRGIEEVSRWWFFFLGEEDGMRSVNAERKRMADARLRCFLFHWERRTASAATAPGGPAERHSLLRRRQSQS